MLKLWHQDKRCHWCQRETIIIFRPPSVDMKKFPSPDNEATIDHLIDRYDGRVQVHGLEITVLACTKCNNLRNIEKTATMPIENLWERARNGPIKEK